MDGDGNWTCDIRSILGAGPATHVSTSGPSPREKQPDSAKPKGRAFGYICPVCGEPIFDSQPTEHADAGLAHALCCQTDDRYDKTLKETFGAGNDVSETTSLGCKTMEVARAILNKTETRARDILRARQYSPIWEQAITLKLDPPFKSYRPDLAHMSTLSDVLTLIEVKGPHRFRRAGIAKAALAAKTYPQFRFELWDWKDGQFKVTIL